MEIIGIGYVIDHCISYFYKKQEKKSYNIYVTDVLKLILEDIAKQFGGSYIQQRFSDIIIVPKKKEETKTPEQIIDNIRSKLSGK